jgi:L-asparaginase
MFTTIQIPTVASQASTSVLMIYTGGTLGMVYDRTGQHLVPFDFSQMNERLPELNRFDFQLTVVALDQPIDSSNVTPDHWLQWAHLIRGNYDRYDGFVILHGTDTMAYSASALSFLLENLNKPVVFTGSQLPLGTVRTDARENLMTALEIASAKDGAGRPLVPEVCIYFHGLLLRGNRAKKVESVHFDAFQSENYPLLAEAGVTIDYNRSLILPYQGEHPLRVAPIMDGRVAILKLFPGITRLVADSTVQMPGLRGLILETYGSGNAPTAGWFIETLRKTVQKGLFVLNVSQCVGGCVVQGRYETSRHLAEIGILSGSDITTEAAVTKMMYVLGKDLPDDEIRRQLTTPLRGEMS